MAYVKLKRFIESRYFERASCY